MTDTPAPKPRPTPRPTPGPGPRPPMAGTAAVDAKELAAAMACGRVDDDGTVYLTTAAGEVEVGQYPSATKEQALEFFARRYLEHAQGAALLEERLAAGKKGEDIARSAKRALSELDEARVVGDVDALRERLRSIDERAGEVAQQQAAEHEDAKQEGIRERLSIIERAEEIIRQAPERIHWKTATGQMNDLLSEWKSVQQRFPRISRSEDSELWGRFSSTRSTFEGMRREFFAGLDKLSAEGKKIKEKIVEEAEGLADSTAWRETADRFRDLMQQWKASPRARRKDDDSLWARFRAAQDAFYSARSADLAERDEEYRGNLAVKEQLLEKAQALLPVRDHRAAKEELRAIQEAWEAAGRVPRGDISRMENGLREVERAVEAAEDAEWKRTDPERRARTTGMLAQLEEQIADLEARAEAAEAEKQQALRDELTTKRQWLEQMRRTADELDG